MHSSWEVSSTTENAGSIVKLDPVGRVVFRIKDHIDYLQEIAINRNGELFAYSLGDTIEKFSADGQFEFSWNAVPPQYGETWKEKKERIHAAANVTEESSLEDLLIGLLYGEYRKQDDVKKWILLRGVKNFPFFLDAYEKFGGWP